MDNIFELQDVTFAYNSRPPNIMDGFNLEIERGKRTAILGCNGAGKSTLFYLLTGVNKPQQGQVLYNGEPIEYTRDKLRELRSDVAIVLQNPDEQIFCSLVEEDIAFGPLNIGMDRDEVEVRVQKALKDVRMTGYEKRPLPHLSGGQRKRIAIAGALVMDPKIMIMDEPTAGLDPQASMEVMELAEKLALRGITVLLSTHEMDLAYKWNDVSKILCQGKVEFTGNCDEFFGDLNNVYKCGLLTPSVYNMNKDISLIEGQDMDPYPHNICEFVAKFGKNDESGRLLLVPSESEDAKGKFDSLSNDMKDCSVGIYGSDVRHELGDREIEYLFDGLDGCFTEVVKGNDAVLFYDPIYETTINNQITRLKTFGFDVKREEMR